MITILLATHNAAAFIQRTLWYISDQRHEDFLCLISDDASVDRTVEICQKHAGKDSRFVVQTREKNIGWVNNTNFLLSQVRTEYFMIMPHDDAILRRYLSTLLDAMTRQPTAIVAYSDVELIVSSGRQETLKFPQAANIADPQSRAMTVFNREGVWFLPYRGLVRTALMADAMKLRLNAAGEFTADLVWIFEMALRGEFVRIPEVLYLKYLQDSSHSRNWIRTPESIQAVNASCYEALGECALNSSQTGNLHALIRSTMA